MWVWDAALGVYHDVDTRMYAIPDASGEWTYTPVEEHVGWGGLMDDTPATRKAIAVLRLVVEQSDVLDVGGVALFDTREGGIQIGRDRCERGAPPRLRLKEMAVSKTHATVYHDDGWWVVDQGSTHGTFAPDRLSEPKHASKPHRIEHLSSIRIGSTTLIAHIHPEWPCDRCKLHGDNELRLDEGKEEPANAATPVEAIYESREERRKKEMAALKKTHLAGPSASAPRSEYTDRAALRRRQNPPLDRPGRRSASPPAARNIGAEILAAQGWTGQGLGKDPGRVEPVQVQRRIERAGLGISSEIGQDWREKAKQRRYDELR